MTWEQTRNMPLTYRVCSAQPIVMYFVAGKLVKIITIDQLAMYIIQVILESLRMASIISFTFREAVVDVEYEGKE